MNVLVLDGNENQAVACVRSLARAGHRVIVGASSAWSKAGWSRDCAATMRYPAPERDGAAFVAAIVQVVRQSPGTLVLPMTERTTLPLSESREEVEGAGGRTVLPTHDSVLRAFDKLETTRLAESLGIAVPRTITLASAADVASLDRTTAYPLVLKPRTSEERHPSGAVLATGAPVYVRDSQELADAYSELRERCSAVIAQEFIEGSGAGYFALFSRGQVRLEFAHRRIRDVRPTGSGSALRVSTALTPQVAEAGRSILSALNWHGVAMVEFRIRSDGSPVFLEVNGRFWNSLALAVYAGADFPRLVAEVAENGDVSSVPTYEIGTRCRWLLGDCRHLVEVWRGAPPNFPGVFPGRLKTLRDVLLPVPGTHHDNFILRDPLPELGDWLSFAMRVVRKQRRKTRAAER
jgi:predicted ATP-grasp superfamily ATP-dependent carboligase